jgi:hypothetical protein
MDNFTGGSGCDQSDSPQPLRSFHAPGLGDSTIENRQVSLRHEQVHSSDVRRQAAFGACGECRLRTRRERLFNVLPSVRHYEVL